MEKLLSIALALFLLLPLAGFSGDKQVINKIGEEELKCARDSYTVPAMGNLLSTFYSTLLIRGYSFCESLALLESILQEDFGGDKKEGGGTDEHKN